MSTENKTPDVLSKRTQVAKKDSHIKWKDRALWVGTVALCSAIVLSGFLPKHHSTEVQEESEKQNASLALNQNLELIAALRTQNQTQTGYHGGDDNHPPLLRTSTSNAVSKETLARMNAPSTFFSVSGTDSPINSLKAKKEAQKTLMGQDVNSQFLNQQNDITTVFAKRLPHPNWTVPAGEMIPATLETAINAELAGMVKAITTHDIYSLSGHKLLLPKGSSVIGQFNTAITQGQRRIFIVWNQIQMSNGIKVTLNSPGTDAIGRAGVAADYVDRHFFERFGSGALLSVLGAFSATGGVNGQDQYNSMAQYRMNVAGSFQQAANQTLQQDMQQNTTLQTNQGAEIKIFVAHDLDFYRVAGRG
jgi:type IV secretion system protein VirB10